MKNDLSTYWGSENYFKIKKKQFKIFRNFSEEVDCWFARFAKLNSFVEVTLQFCWVAILRICIRFFVLPKKVALVYRVVQETHYFLNSDTKIILFADFQEVVSFGNDIIFFVTKIKQSKPCHRSFRYFVSCEAENITTARNIYTWTLRVAFFLWNGRSFIRIITQNILTRSG